MPTLVINAYLPLVHFTGTPCFQYCPPFVNQESLTKVSSLKNLHNRLCWKDLGKCCFENFFQARGPKKHLKRVAAPKHWMLDKLTGVFVSTVVERVDVPLTNLFVELSVENLICFIYSMGSIVH